jgi:hypothetical protein
VSFSSLLKKLALNNAFYNIHFAAGAAHESALLVLLSAVLDEGPLLALDF